MPHHLRERGRITSKAFDSPVLTAPALGTPASGVMTNMTGAVEASFVDDAITIAKMDDHTDGNIITYDASGNPTYVATGSDGQVLTSTGSGVAWEDAAGGVEGNAFASDLKIGRDSQNLIDFATTDNKIIFRVNNVDEIPGNNGLSYRIRPNKNILDLQIWRFLQPP